MDARVDRRGIPFHRLPKAYSPSGDELDGTDLAILLHLQIEAARSNQELGRLIGLKEGGAARRVRLLEHSGVIVRRVIEIAPEVFEAWSALSIEITLTPHGRRHRATIEERLCAAPEVIEAIEAHGEADILMRAAFAASSDWGALRARLDPDQTLIERARVQVLGRPMKRLSPHPLLVASESNMDWIVGAPVADDETIDG